MITASTGNLSEARSGLNRRAWFAVFLGGLPPCSYYLVWFCRKSILPQYGEYSMGRFRPSTAPRKLIGEHGNVSIQLLEARTYDKTQKTLGTKTNRKN